MNTNWDVFPNIQLGISVPSTVVIIFNFYYMEFSPGLLHPIFHVSCLKKVIGGKFPVQKMLPELEKEGKFIFEREEVTKTRT